MHQSFKILPGVDQTKTPTLNEAAVSVSQLVRFLPDRTLGGIIQKLGGWTKYIPTKVGSIVRNLWAWEDTNSNSYLAVGAEGTAPIVVTGASGNGTTVTLTFAGPHSFVIGYCITVSGITPSGYNGTYAITATTANSVSYASTFTTAYVSGGLIYGGGGTLLVAQSNNLTDITPQNLTGNVAVSFGTTAGSNSVLVTIANSNVQNFDTINIQTQVSVGGIVLYGQYQCYSNTTNSFYIYATNILGEPDNATTTVTGGAVPSYATSNNSSLVTVTLNDHGYLPGSTFPALVATTVGGITIYGNYTVLSVPSANTFTIKGSTLASSTTTGSENGGQLHYVLYRGISGTYAPGGYGVGSYGAGGYGTGVTTLTGITGVPINAVDWSLDNWGQILIACPLNGPIYQWDPTSGSVVASVIPEAPSVNAGCFVAMPQRQIIAWGSTLTGIIDPLLIRWCDVNDFNNWTPTFSSLAGSYRIPKGSKIVQCIQGHQQGLVWTDLGVWAMQFVGPNDVYNFNELGTGCGLIGRKAAGSMSGSIYWMGQSQFYRMSGAGPEAIKCPVWDVAFQDLDRNNTDKIRFAANSRFGEVTWYYPTTSNNGEVSHYVKYNAILDQWDYGTLGRTAWINESVLGPPIGADPTTTYIYQHETSPDADGQPMNSYFQTGYFAITEAENKMFIDQVWPDMKWGYYDGSQSANVLLTFYATDYPGQTPIAYGPYTLTQATTYITPRFRGRLVSIKVESNDIGSFWRLGNIRYRVQPDGKF